MPDPPENKGRMSPKVFIVAGAVLFVIFLACEVCEHTRLFEINPGLEHLIGIFQGLSTSVIVGFVVCLYLLRNRPSIFPAESGSSRLGEDFTGHIEERAVHFSRWFIRMRWIACTVAVVLIVVSIEAFGFLENAPLVPLLILAVLLALTNIAYMYMLKHGLFKRHFHELQILTDLLILTGMLHYSGGVENPISFAYVFHILIAGILLDSRKCYATVAVASILFSAMAICQMGGILPHYRLEIFPHAPIEMVVPHAAHQPIYVVSIVAMQIVFMSLTAYFITTITERLRAEERLASAHRQRLERVIAATGAGFAIVDRQLRPVWLNQQIRQWLSLPGSNGNSWNERFEEWSGGKDGPVAKVFCDGGIRVVERSIDVHGLGQRFFQTTVAPLTNSSGEIFQVVELTQDVTERKIAETEMAHSSRMAALGLMAAGIAHEIGNPLASLSTRMHLLESRHDESFLKESLKLLQHQISRIGRIVHGVSQFAKQPEKEWSACNVTPVIQEVLSMLKFRSPPQKIEIHSDLSRDLPEVMGAKDQLQQIFLNVGLNAIEAMPDGGTLSVATSTDQREIRVSFVDTGKGIDEDARAKIFTPFFTTKKSGLGLGLSIVHNIVTAHGGRIEVGANIPKGTRITIFLPVRPREGIPAQEQIVSPA